MHKKITGIHRVRKTLAGGTIRYNYYCWRGGPRFWHCDHKPAPKVMPQSMLEAYDAAIAEHGNLRKQARAARKDVHSLVEAYRDSDDFQDLKPVTRKSYNRYLDQIKGEFGDDEYAAFEDKLMRADIKQWHRSMADTPRAADLALSVLTKILSFAVDESMISRHVAGDIKRLHKADRSAIIWEPQEIETLLASGGRHIGMVIRLAAYSALRRTDLAQIAQSADRGDHLVWWTSKSNKRTEIVIPIVPGCRALLDEIADERRRLGSTATTILVNSRGLPWTPDGIDTSFRKAKLAAGIDKHLHDMRGTAATHFMTAGFTDPEIAEIVGWRTTDVAKIRRKYVDRNRIVSAAIARLERSK